MAFLQIARVAQVKENLLFLIIANLVGALGLLLVVLGLVFVFTSLSVPKKYSPPKSKEYKQVKSKLIIKKANYKKLAENLRKSLSKYNYTEEDRGLIGNINFVAIFKSPRKQMTSYIFAVAKIPDDVSDFISTKQFFDKIRESLISKYVKSPILRTAGWKELGTYSILLCKHELYEKLKDKVADFKDPTGLHKNVMLGTCFIDTDKAEYSFDSTWGGFFILESTLILSAKQFINGANLERKDDSCARQRPHPIKEIRFAEEGKKFESIHAVPIFGQVSNFRTSQFFASL